MHALRFYEPGRVAVVDVPDPHAGPGEVVLKLHATGLCNSDVRVYLGEKKAAAGVIPGHELSGEVAEVGAGAEAAMGEVIGLCPILCCGRCSFGLGCCGALGSDCHAWHSRTGGPRARDSVYSSESG